LKLDLATAISPQIVFWSLRLQMHHQKLMIGSKTALKEGIVVSDVAAVVAEIDSKFGGVMLLNRLNRSLPLPSSPSSRPSRSSRKEVVREVVLVIKFLSGASIII
jgi:hypothetical protein